MCACACVRPHLELGALAAVGGEGLELLLNGGELVALELAELLPLLRARLTRYVLVQRLLVQRQREVRLRRRPARVFGHLTQVSTNCEGAGVYVRWVCSVCSVEYGVHCMV